MDIKKVVNVTINLSIAVYILLILASYMNWVNVAALRFIIAPILAIAVATQFFISKNKGFISYVTLIASLIIIVTSINSILNIQFLNGLNAVFGVSVLFIIITQATRLNKIEVITTNTNIDDYEFGKEEDLSTSYSPKTPEDKTSKNNLPKTLFAISVALIVLGMFFKLMHYPGSSILNILGFGGAVLCTLYYTFQSRTQK